MVLCAMEMPTFRRDVFTTSNVVVKLITYCINNITQQQTHQSVTSCASPKLNNYSAALPIALLYTYIHV